MNKKAFTLVELIVVITILAVLATVAFISFQGYGQSARDSTRLSDMKSMEKLLDLSKLTNNRYPTPVNSASVTYSGSVAWTQGVFGQTAYTGNASMSNVPVDPVTALEYPYSITANGQEYQLAAVLENPEASMITSTYAGDQEAQIYVKGNYNGQFLKVRRNNTTYLLGVPSILTSDIVSSQLLEDILTNNRLVYNGHKNLPSSFSGSVYKTDGGFAFGGAPYVASDMILFVGDTSDLETDPAQRVALLDKLQASYSGSVIQTESGISELLSVDSSSAGASSNYVALALNNSLKTSITIQDVVEVVADATPTCTSNPSANPDSDFAFDSGANTITGYTGGAGGVIIPCTIGGVDVLVIGVSVFESSSITSIIIPDSVTSIEEKAFYDNQLTNLTIPDSVISIGNTAFRDNQLTNLTIPDGVISIGDYAFRANQLTSISLGNNDPIIGKYAFAYNLLGSITIPSSFTSIGEAAFYQNQLTSVTIPGGITSIGKNAFGYNLLESIIIPDGVISIGNGAFKSNLLTSITIGNGITSISLETFMNNELESVTIPEGVISIGNSSFRDNDLTILTIASTVTSIGENAFYNNLLTSIIIPDSVTSMGRLAFSYNKLTSLTIGSGITSIETSTFNNNLLMSVTIPNSVTSLGQHAFSTNLLTSITIPSSVTTIAWRAFRRNNLEANTIVIMCPLPTFEHVDIFVENGPLKLTDIANPGTCL